MKKNIVIINRWTAAVGFTNFEDYIDHKSFRVHYIVTENGVSSIRVSPEQMGRFSVVDEFNYQTLADVLLSLTLSYGEIHCLIAMAEKDLLGAGQLRDRFHIKGQSFEEARKFIDKGVMKAIIEKAGIPTPRFKELTDGTGGLKFPLILKPKCESSSREVIKISDEAQLTSKISSLDQKNYLVEEFCPDHIYHLDGFVFRGEIVFLSSSQYIGMCLDHSHGEPLGSVRVTDHIKNKILSQFAFRVVAAMSLAHGSFHLECFMQNEEAVFLEIAARAGGGDIREILLITQGFNIVKAWIDTQLGKAPEIPSVQDTSLSSGFLIFPGPTRPSTMLKASSFQKTFTCIKREYIPAEGYQFSGSSDIFTNSAARYLFHGSECEIRYAIEKIKSSFYVCYLTDLESAI